MSTKMYFTTCGARTTQVLNLFIRLTTTKKICPPVSWFGRGGVWFFSSSSSLLPPRPCCSPFPPHERLLAAMVGGRLVIVCRQSYYTCKVPNCRTKVPHHNRWLY